MPWRTGVQKAANMYLGIDCGGSSTKAVLADETGNIIGWGEGGPANYGVDGKQNVLRSISEASVAALGRGNASKDQISQLAVGISGAGRLSEQQDIAANLQQLGYGEPVVVADAKIALVGATCNQPGVILISGTGSIAYGMNQDGQFVRVGGWGYLLGDEGSAFAIAREALRCAFASYDGRLGRDQLLEQRVLEFFGVSDLQQLIPIVYSLPLERRKIGGFAPQVVELAVAGDSICQTILTTAGRELAELASAVLMRLGLTNQGSVYLTGGTFLAGDVLLTPFTQALWARFPGTKVAKPQFPPVIGALLLGFKQQGRVSGDVIGKLRQSLHTTPYGKESS